MSYICIKIAHDNSFKYIGLTVFNHNRLKRHHQEQGELLPTYPSDIVAEDHLARVVNEVVDSLDLKLLYHKYSSEGGTTFHPKVMVKILFYGYSQGERSSRRISKQCRENFVYMYLAAGIKPDFRTISEFRRKNIDLIKPLFQQIVLICYRLGMISIGQICLDGTKVKANAANRKIVHNDKLNQELEQIEQQISQLLAEAEAIDATEDTEFGRTNRGDELPSKLQKAIDRKQEITTLLTELKQQGLDKMSLTDNESRFMKSHGRIQLSYNAQCATEKQIIVAYDVTDKEDDSDQLVSMVTELEEIATKLTAKSEFPLSEVKLLADAGYDSGKNLQHLADRKIDSYVTNLKARLKAKERTGKIAVRQFSKDKFSYHQEGNYYECPTGQRLEFSHTKINQRKTYKRTDLIYRGVACHQCRYQRQCVNNKTGSRTSIRFAEYDAQRELIDAKLATATGKAIMKQRRIDVEPVFSHIKQQTFRNGPLLLRSKHKAKGEFGLASIVHNIKKIANFINSAKNDNKLAEIRNLGLQLA